MLTSKDLGRRISVRITGTLTGHSTSAETSSGSVPVKAGALATKKPRLEGTKRVGSRLRATPGTWGPGKVTVRYQWLRAGKAIKNATKKTYVLKARDRGQRISVRITGSKKAFLTAQRTSDRTIRITR